MRYIRPIFYALLVSAGLYVHPVAAAEAAGPPAKPPAAFQTCVACHSNKPGVTRLGPSLAGIFGKPAAQAKGFRYSPALVSAKLRWDRRTLNAFIAKPRSIVPATSMAYAGVGDPAKRQLIIDYLETLR